MSAKDIEGTEEERHPSFGLAHFNTVQISPPGASLFDSEIRHQHAVTFEVHRAKRRRQVNRDWLFPEGAPIVSMTMSQAQFGALVSSFNNGNGVPVTLDFTEADGRIDSPQYEPRLRQSVNEVVGTADRLFGGAEEVTAKLRAAFDAKAGRKEMAELLRSLEIALGNARPNLKYAAETLNEHVENVVTKARYDIEAAVQMAAERGLSAGDSVAGLLGQAPEETT